MSAWLTASIFPEPGLDLKARATTGPAGVEGR